MVSPPLMKAGRQKDQSCQNLSQSCLWMLSAGLLWTQRADGLASQDCIQASLTQKNKYSLQKILCFSTPISMPAIPRAADRPAPLQEVT